MKLLVKSHFVTKQRLIIVIASIILSVLLIGLASIAGSGSLLGGLLINLAASALTVGATVAIVDYLLAKEKDNQLLEGRMMASLEAKSIQMLIGTGINNLFRKYTSKDSNVPNSDENAYIKHLFSYLDHTDFTNTTFKFHSKDIAFFEDEVIQAMSSIEKINVMYGYALTSTNRSKIHHLYTCLRAVNSILSARKYALRGTKQAPKNAVRELKEKFDQSLMLLGEELYLVSKDMFIVDIEG